MSQVPITVGTTANDHAGMNLRAFAQAAQLNFSELYETLTAYTVDTLPAGVKGARAYVTDATAPTFLGTLTGGGSVVCPVFYNGSAWVAG